MTEQTIQHYINNVRFTFNCGWRHLVKKGAIAYDKHQEIEIVYHIRGHGTIRTGNGGDFPFSQGSVSIQKPAILHSQDTFTNGEDIVIAIGCDNCWPKEFAEIITVEKTEDEYLLRELNLLSEAGGNISGLQQKTFNYRATALLCGLLAESTSQKTREEMPPSFRHAQAARHYIRQNYARISQITDISDYLQISSDHLRHVMQHYYQISPQKHLNSVRIDRAKALLLQSNLSVKAIASQCGFSTTRYFCTCFKTACGLTPVQFKNSR